MQPVPDYPPAEDAALDGHLWVLEHVEGTPVRFSVATSGLISFAGPRRRFGTFDDVPLPYRAAAREVRRSLDLSALRAAAPDPGGVTFVGIATRRERFDYDWRGLPAFLGTEVWSPQREAFLPPDAVARVYDRLGLARTNPVEKEVPSSHLDIAEYPMPQSSWSDGPAAGVSFLDKTGGRARLSNPDPPDRPEAVRATPADLVDRFVTAERLDRAVRTLEAEGRPASVDAVTERILERVVREEYGRLYRDDEPSVDLDAFRAAAVESVGRRLG